MRRGCLNLLVAASLLASTAILSSPMGAAAIEVSFEKVRESPVEVVFEVEVRSKSEESARVQLANTSFNALKAVINVYRVRESPLVVSVPVYGEKETTLNDAAAIAPPYSTLKEKLETLKEILPGDTRKPDLADYLTQEELGKIPDYVSYVVGYEEITKTVRHSRHVAKLGQGGSFQTEPGVVKYEIAINTGTLKRGTGWGSAGLLKLIVDGKEYYDLSASSWWDNSWAYRNVLSFTVPTIDEDLLNFAVRVHLMSANFDFTKARADGGDIRFVDADDTTNLPYEIEKWDYGNEAIIWVRVPKIDRNTSYTDYIYIYYGNPDATDNQQRNKVWGDWSEISYCEATTDWTGTSVTLETTDIKEGTGAIRDTVSSPTAGTTYSTVYNPAGTWDFSNESAIVSFSLKSDRADGAFTSARLYLYDTAGNYKYWNLGFSAGTWADFSKTVAQEHGASGGFDASAVDRLSIEFVAKDTTPFYKLVDFVELRTGAITVMHFSEMSGSVVSDSTRFGNDASFPYDAGDVAIASCDATTDFSVSAGTLEVDSVNYKEGTASIKWTVPATATSTTYILTYDPTALMNLGKRQVDFYIKCDAASTDFASVNLKLTDSAAATQTSSFSFAAATWERKLIGIDTGALNEAEIDKIEWRFTTTATPTPASFIINLDIIYSNGGPTWYNYNLKFDGVNDYVDCKGNVTNAASVGIWVKVATTQPGAYETALSLWVSASDRLEVIGWAGAPFRFYGVEGGINTINLEGVNWRDDQWHHIVGTWDANGAKLFVDGAQTDSATGDLRITWPANPTVYMGNVPTQGGRLLDGVIGEVRIYSQTLSAEQIEAEELNRTDSLIYCGGTDPPPTVETLPAENVYMDGGTHATLVGELTDLGGAPSVDVWFEVDGKTLGKKTLTTTGQFRYTYEHFQPGRTFRYRAVAENVDGVSYGSYETFRAETAWWTLIRFVPLLVVFFVLAAAYLTIGRTSVAAATVIIAVTILVGILAFTLMHHLLRFLW